MSQSSTPQKAQTAVEYLLILMIVAIVVLVGMATFLPRVNQSGDILYNRAGESIMGQAPVRLEPLPLPPGGGGPGGGPGG